MIRLRDGLAIVRDAWMSWWRYARPYMEKSDRVFVAAQSVSEAISQLEKALREEVKE